MKTASAICITTLIHIPALVSLSADLHQYASAQLTVCMRKQRSLLIYLEQREPTAMLLLLCVQVSGLLVMRGMGP